MKTKNSKGMTFNEYKRREQAAEEKIKGIPGGLKVTVESVRIPRRPGSDSSQWGKEAFHFSTTLTVYQNEFDLSPKFGGKSFTMTYSQGSGHCHVKGLGHYAEVIPNKPFAADVLASLLSDASIYQTCNGVDDYAKQFCDGMEVTDILETYNQCRKELEFLQSALGKHFEAVQEYFSDY